MSEYRRRLLMSKKEESPQIEYVDLGLPSGTLWAKCNLGATSETEYGDYYMWGSTEPDTNNICNWAHAPFNNGSSSFDLTYFNAHKSEWLEDDILKPEYDAAHVQLGGDWRMPTNADFLELIANTTSVWVTNYQGSGVKGWKFTASNNNTIFIPASGTRLDSHFESVNSLANSWSSKLYLSSSNSGDKAFFLYSTSTVRFVSQTGRWAGTCVRPVCKP